MNATLLPAVISLTGVLGLLIGSFLNVVVWRVPRGESLLPGSHCPDCDSRVRPLHNVPIVSWLVLGGRCADCGRRISARYPLVELGTAVAFAGVTWWFAMAGAPIDAAWWIALSAYLWLTAATIALTLIDIDHKRLPDAIVLPSLAVVAILLSLSSALSMDLNRLLITLGAASAMFALYFAIAFVYPAGLGGGDVKLAPLIGAMLGFIGWGAVVVGAFAGFLFGAVFGLGLIALRRATRKTGIPFGPFMLLGAWFGVFLGEPIMAAYLRTMGLI